MISVSRRLLASILAACGCLASFAAAFAQPAPIKPKLVVAIAIDQFSLGLFDAYRPTFTGGLKRLSQGVVFTGYQSHGATETCPGHSTILTGDHPARTRVVATAGIFGGRDRTSTACRRSKKARTRSPGRRRN